MKAKRMLLLLVLALILAGSTLALGQVGVYSLNWFSVDGGGGSLSNDDYTLQSSLG